MSSARRMPMTSLDVIAFVPFTVLLPLRLGLDGILWAAPAADLVGLLFSILFIRQELSRMKQQRCGERVRKKSPLPAILAGASDITKIPNTFVFGIGGGRWIRSMILFAENRNSIDIAGIYLRNLCLKIPHFSVRN